MTIEFTILQGEEAKEAELPIIETATKILEFASSVSDNPMETAMALSLAVVLFAKTHAEQSGIREILHGVALAYKHCEEYIEFIPAAKGTSTKQ